MCREKCAYREFSIENTVSFKDFQPKNSHFANEMSASEEIPISITNLALSSSVRQSKNNLMHSLASIMTVIGPDLRYYDLLTLYCCVHASSMLAQE